MNILFVSAASSMHTVRWVNALSQRGNKVTLVSLKNHKAYADTISKKVKILYLPFEGAKGYYLNALYLRKIFQKNKFDIVNVHYASGYGTLARVAGLPNILLNVWGSDVYEFPYQSKIKKRILRKNLNYAAWLASTSHSMAKQTERLLDSKKRIEITPFGVDIQKFRPKDSYDKNDKFIFGIVKALSPKYGIHTVIEAFSKFLEKVEEKEKISQTRLEIYGNGEQLEELKLLVKKKEIEGQVYFGGFVPNEQVPDLLRKMDVYLLGSTRESFGVAAVEAMSCGLPVIATKASGFEEVIEDKRTGFLVPVNDSAAMADYMTKLYYDGELRKKMGAAGRLRVKTLYDWNMNVDNMLNVYKKVLSDENK